MRDLCGIRLCRRFPYVEARPNSPGAYNARKESLGFHVKDQLVEKLRAAISEEIVSECQVVYILAECRKLLDKYPPDKLPFALKIYCHWALHVDLTNPGTTGEFMEGVDRFVESVLAGSRDILEEDRMFREIAYWKTFRQQLQQILITYDLPTSICDEDARWHDFLRYYARVIEDGSLSCESKNQRLKYVSRVVVEKGSLRPTANLAPFDLAFHVSLIDGRALTVSVSAHAFPDGTPYLSHSVQIHW